MVLVANRLPVILGLLFLVGCAHSQSSEFDQLMSVIDRRDQCIGRLEAHVGDVPVALVPSIEDIVDALSSSVLGEVRVELRRVARSASKRGVEGAELGSELRRYLAEVDLFRIRYCGAVAVEVLPNILSRRLSDRDRQLLSDRLGKNDSREVEDFIFAVVALKLAKIEWDISDFQ